MPLTKDGGFDAAVVDKDNLPVALIQVKARPFGEKWTPLLRTQMQRASKILPHAAFLFAIDPQSIRLYRLGETEPADPIVNLETPKILSHYDPDFTKERIFEKYLMTLVEAWLRDLAYHWKSPNPPGSDELKGAGFLSKVEGGTTRPPGD